MKPRVRVKAGRQKSATVLRLVPPSTQSDPQIIAHIETLLEMANRGELNSVAIAASRHDGGFTTAYHGWAGNLLGPISVVQYRVLMGEVEV